MCICVTCVLVLAGCKMLSDALELGFEAIVGFLMGAGNLDWISGALKEQ